MWHLNQPTEDTISWYKKKYLDAIRQDIQNSDIEQVVQEILFEERNGKSVLEMLLISKPAELYALNTEIEDKLASLGNAEKNKEKINEKLDYDGRISRNKREAYELANRIGTRTCVYCNRIYSFTIETIGGETVARPDFDHWLSQEKYPLLAMSFFNLIPSCPICNRSIKLRQEFKYGVHVHPYCSPEETQFQFQYAAVTGGKWKLTLANGSQEEMETAKMLKTEDIYRPYADGEVKDLLDFAYRNPPEYLLDLKEKVMKAYGSTISEEQAYRMIFGTEMHASLFLDRPLSKMKRDVLRQLQEALGISLIRV